MSSVEEIHKVLLGLEKRAENKPDDIIATTFVDAAPLLDILSAPVSQVIFGRRGTGKTHALKYCLSSVKDQREAAVYLDIRSIGSNNSIYSDSSVPEVERGLSLVNDILSALLHELYVFSVSRIDQGFNSSQITSRLDDFAQAIGNVSLSGGTTVEHEVSKASNNQKGFAFKGKADRGSAGVETSVEMSLGENENQRKKVQTSGHAERIINFSQTQSALDGLLRVLGIERMWLFLDEWSETPRSIQPYLADLLRKTVLPTGRVVIKIAAIEQRSRFVFKNNVGDYVGLELGADISVDLNLDDFLVFDYDEVKATAFFKELIYKNYLALAGSKTEISSSSKLSGMLFTEKRALEEFTRAVEGVPRDALNLISKIVTKAYGQKASVDDVRRAALDWYTQDKVNVVNNSPELHQSLNHIVDEVIANRRARAFLFPSNVRHTIIDQLYDARVLHLLKKNISSRDEIGKRYDVWKIDYGCYVDLIKTKKAPVGLLPDGDETYVDVPTDDYRSIRRAVLMPEDLDRFISSGTQYSD